MPSTPTVCAVVRASTIELKAESATFNDPVREVMFCRYWVSELDCIRRFTREATAAGLSDREFNFCPVETCCKA